MTKDVRVHLLISGRVQGVCFRAYAEEEAVRQNLTGWIRNTERGEVEALFEGEASRVREMIDWCHKGPPTARVKSVKAEWEPYRGDMADFRITH